MASKATVVLLFLWGNGRFSAEDNAKFSARFSFFENKRLKGYVARRFDSRSLLSCGQQCLRKTWCTSINFKFSTKRKDEGTCELNKHEMSIVDENNNFSDDEGTTFSLLHRVCEKGWVLHSRSCYLVLDTPTQSWTEARRICKSHGGDLPVIRSADENKFMRKSVQGLRVWIGLYRKSENEFYWVDDTPVTSQFSSWAKREPSSKKNEECVHMYAGKDPKSGKWNDAPCNFPRHFKIAAPSTICQRGLF